MRVNESYRRWHQESNRARLRGLAANPALPDELFRRLLDHPEAGRWVVTRRRAWSDEAFDIIAGHPDDRLRAELAESWAVTGAQRARLVGDPSVRVRVMLADGSFGHHDPMPVEAYQRLAEDPNPKVRMFLTLPRKLPHEVLEKFAESPLAELAAAARAALSDPWRPEPDTFAAGEAETLARSEAVPDRCRAAGAPELPADLVAELAADPDRYVRLLISMRPELTEEQQAAIDYRVGPDDRLPVLDWVREATPEVLRRCVHSAHIGLRRSAVHHRGLTPDLIAVLAADEDFAVRLMLCEQQDDVPPDLVVRTYLEARVISRGNLLRHPRFPRTDLVRFADSPHWEARALVVLDPGASPALIDRLSRDEHPGVRRWTAADERLTAGRVLDLLADDETAEPSAANPNLPVQAMEQIIAAGAVLAAAPEDAAVLLGHTNPAHEPVGEI
ncbi:hypothetical protein [Actinoplanes aureus]|uniref:Uncharacterized protein n=1 Tax=Actinoplanes aureus TaxID=2792083 RepID=A0A931C2R6_9ACTN|nr:hypothetical protein [Actinoplanes aureus]MBG0562295.1 hypothetical protein [Actinoplanes aureus]